MPQSYPPIKWSPPLLQVSSGTATFAYPDPGMIFRWDLLPVCMAADETNIDFRLFDLLLGVNLGLAHSPHYVNAKRSCSGVPPLTPDKVQPIAYIQVMLQSWAPKPR